jgi:hypothetical protein
VRYDLAGLEPPRAARRVVGARGAGWGTGAGGAEAGPIRVCFDHSAATAAPATRAAVRGAAARGVRIECGVVAPRAARRAHLGTGEAGAADEVRCALGAPPSPPSY